MVVICNWDWRSNIEYEDDSVIDTAVENIVLELNTRLMWIRDPLLLDETSIGNADLSDPLDWQTSIECVNQLEYGFWRSWQSATTAAANF